jgi:peptidyl-prolyl cis-trans isomerase B (cyclophilin B)
MKVRLTTTEGDIVIALNTEAAPKTTANFLQYVEDSFYDGTVFHRVISGFMVQGGGFEAGMNQKSTRTTIENEADNGLTNTRGSVAMARTPDPHSASAQFFVNCSDNDFLNFQEKTTQGWGYCVFGEVTEGLDVISRMEECATGSSGGHQDVPVDDIIISKAVQESD